MPITLDGIELDDQLEWTDEYDWSLVEQQQERSLSGALIVQEGLKRYGRPITLASNGGAWTPLSVVQQLEGLRDQVGKVMDLTLANGAKHRVIFNHSDGAPLTATAIERRVNPPPDWPYDISLRLITVAPPATA